MYLNIMKARCLCGLTFCCLIMLLGPGGIAPSQASSTPWVDASSFPSFTQCVKSSKSAGKTILISKPMRVASLTIPANRDLRFVNGGSLLVTAKQTLTIKGTIDAPLIKIFDGYGLVRFQNGNVRQIYPQWWGAKGDGYHDDTNAIQRAINAKTGYSTIFFPSGAYYCTSTITIKNDRTHLVGSGDYSTTFIFNPSRAAVLFNFVGVTPQTTLYSCSLTHMGFVGMGDSRKVALQMVNTSEMVVENISIYSSWHGSGSIGILMHGRELTMIRRATIFADRPIVIGNNLSKGPEGFIDSDHLHMQDLYLGPQEPDEACIHIASGVNLTNFVLDGTNSFVTAKYGIYWNDTSSDGTSNNMTIKNVRVEQSSDSSGYALYLSHNYGLQNLIIENVTSDTISNGFFLRNCRFVTLLNCLVQTTTGEAVNADNSCDEITFLNCLFQEGSKALLPGLAQQFGLFKSNSAAPIPATSFYIRDQGSSAGNNISVFGSKTWSHSGMLDNDETFMLPAGNGTGRKASIITVSASGENGITSGGMVIDSPEAANALSGTNNFGIGNLPGKLTVLHEDMTYLFNQTGTPLDYVVTVSWN